MASQDEYGLTANQRAFADLYRAAEDPQVRGNAAACYRGVYGRTGKTAEAGGSRTLRNPRVRAYLAKCAAQATARANVSQERALEELARIAFLDPRKIFSPGGTVLPPSEWSDDLAAAIAGFDIVETKIGDDVEITIRKIRFWSKDRSLELLTKILQLIKETGPTTSTELNMVYQRIVAAAAQEGRIPGAPPRSGALSGGS